MAMNGVVIDRNGDSLTIELSKGNEGKIRSAPTTLMNRDIEEIDQHSNHPNVTILHPQELQDQGTTARKNP